MQGPTDEASVPTPTTTTTTTSVMGGRILSGTMRRKIGKRTYPWPTVATVAAAAAAVKQETPTLPPLASAAKKPRLQAPSITITSAAIREDGVEKAHTAAERVTTDAPHDDDTPTVPVTPHTTPAATATATSLPSAGGASRAPARRNWNEEEDTKLTEAVKRHGTAWVAVAALVPGRTNIQCRQRWTQTLDPDMRKIAGRWTKEEDTKLIEAVKRHGTAWVVVAALVPDRTNDQCRSRWTETLDPDIGKSAGKWTKEEDTKLAEAVKIHGKSWLAVAALVPGRTNIQCRSRWIQAVGRGIGKSAGKWTKEEDTKLAEAVKKHGTHWVVAADHVLGRTNIQCRYRWIQAVGRGNGKKAGTWTQS
jgi:hypothetical protein